MATETNRLGTSRRKDGTASRRAYAKRFHELLFGVVRSLTSAIDARDPYTRGHSERVARMAVELARQLGLEPKEISNLYLGGLLHDVGKIGIDDRVLKKPDKLTPEEYQHIMSHVEIGVSIVKEIRALRHLLPAIKHHHERYDGRGYPSGLAGEDIPMHARILAVADSFDAMFNERAYRPRRSAADVQRILREEAGRQWDPQVVAAAFARWVELTGIQERGLGNSLRCAVEEALPLKDNFGTDSSQVGIRDGSLPVAPR